MNLQLSLKTKWFEMTKAGIKTEDYRELNYYWFNRLVRNSKNVFSQLIGSTPNCNDLDTRNKCAKDIVLSDYFKPYSFIDFETNIMTLGYPKSTDKQRILKLEHKGIEIRTGNPEWGAEPNKLYFVILHGSQIA